MSLQRAAGEDESAFQELLEQELRQNERPGGTQSRLLDDPPQLADVTWPPVRLENAQDFRCESANVPVGLPREPAAT